MPVSRHTSFEESRATPRPVQLFCARHDASPTGPVAVSHGGAFAAYGTASGLCVVDLGWPWRPCRTLPLGEAGPTVALEWGPRASGGRVAVAGARGALGLFDLAAESNACALLASLRGTAPAGEASAAAAYVDALAWNASDPQALLSRTSHGAIELYDFRAGGRARVE